MHRIDGPTASTTLPAATDVVGTPGYWTNGDPAEAVPPTIPTQDWFNTVQEELSHIVESAGGTLDKGNHNQLLLALQTLFVSAAGGSSEGSVLAVPGHRIAADGFLEQWGLESTPNTNEHGTSLVFPIPFPNACFGIEFTTINPSSSTSGITVIQEVSLSTTGASVFVQDQNSSFSDAGGGFRWRAWGH